MKGAVTVSADTEAMLNARIAEIDALLTDQLNAIMHDPEFQKLEASWRGLHYLVDKSETSTKLQIRVIHATKKELLRDMEKAKEFDQSALFKKIYDGRVRRLRRRAVRGPDRRLRVRQAPAGHLAAEADLAGGRRGARPVPLGGLAEPVRVRELRRPRRRSATSPRSSGPATTTSGRRSARARTPATSGSACPTS